MSLVNYTATLSFQFKEGKCCKNKYAIMFPFSRGLLIISTNTPPSVPGHSIIWQKHNVT